MSFDPLSFCLGVLVGWFVLPVVSPLVGRLWCAYRGHTGPPSFNVRFGRPEPNVVTLVRCAMYRCRRCNQTVDITSRAQAEALGIEPLEPE